MDDIEWDEQLRQDGVAEIRRGRIAGHSVILKQPRFYNNNEFGQLVADVSTHDFLYEAQLMRQNRHQNILLLHGIVNEERQQRGILPKWLVFE